MTDRAKNLLFLLAMAGFMFVSFFLWWGIDYEMDLRQHPDQLERYRIYCSMPGHSESVCMSSLSGDTTDSK